MLESLWESPQMEDKKEKKANQAKEIFSTRQLWEGKEIRPLL